MVRPSNPLLMSTVLDAVENLSDKKGSTIRDIIYFVQQNSNGSFRNLTVQVQRALKHAVNASLLQHRGGRYKILLSINPVSAKQFVNEDTKFNDNFTDKLSNESSERPIRSIKNSNSKKQNRKQMRRKGIANRSRECTNSRKSPDTKGKVRSTRKYKRKSDGRVEDNDDWRSSIKRKQFFELEENDLLQSDDHPYENVSNYDSDNSEDNSYDKSINSKNKFYSRVFFCSFFEECLLSSEKKRSTINQEHKGQSSKSKPRKRSSSRNRAQQRSNCNNQNQNEQQQIEIVEVPNDHLEDSRMDCEEQVPENVENIDTELSNSEVDRDCKPNNSGSGSTF
ncbi:hypothetical protein M0802_014621 [Mischocyttarus mexicanus]|nr:hypothetical protein M0802_014621 [Mischocyttarus mexicanus]